MTPFRYVKVSRRFIAEELAGRIRCGESIVLLGHPNGGKGYTCRALEECLGPEIEGKVVRADFEYGDTVTTADELSRRMRRAVKECTGIETPMDSAILEPIDALGIPQPLLIACNVDSLAHQVARQFLQEVRVRVEQRRLVVILTGEYNLQELVYGPNSEFTAAGQYVLQGFESDEFAMFLNRHEGSHGIAWENPAENALSLYNLTGGNLSVARTLMDTCLDLRFRMGAQANPLWRTQWIEQQLANIDIATRLYRRILQYPILLIQQHPDSWAHLKQLIATGQAILPRVTDIPESLTLSGLAVREHATLRFSSELVAAAVRMHYTEQRLGDLYASVGRWNEALEHYRKIRPEQRLRPITAFDRGPTERVLHILGSSLHQAAARGVDAVEELFSDGCRFVMGFPEVVFWRRIGDWKPMTVSGEAPSSDAISAGREILAEVSATSDIEMSIAPPWEGAVLGTRLKGIWEDQPCAVLIGDFGSKRLLSHERHRLADDLIREFRDAHNHAANLERDRTLLKYRDRFEQITREIVEALGSQILDVDGVLRSAAAGIASLGYLRVFFSLVNPTEDRIKGILMEPAGHEFTPEMSNWRLEPAHADIQPFVVKTRQPLSIEDTATHPLTDKRLYSESGIKAMALVPLCTSAGRVLGTLHLDRRDRSSLSDEEIGEFLQFGRTLAALIEQGERIHMMQSALDHQSEPLLIVDACRRVRYGNEPASRLFPELIPGRWRTVVDPWNPTDVSPVGQEREIEAALEGKRVFRGVAGLGNDPDYRGSILAEPIRNRRDEIMGAFVHVQDLNYFFRVLRALEEAASAWDVPSCTEKVLEGMEILGHKWRRLWLRDNVTGELTARSQFGFPTGSPEAEAFMKTRMPANETPAKTWLCVKERRPVVFCYTGKEEEFVTRNGLPVVGLSGQRMFHQALGEYWIDVPLLAGTDVVGKMSLQADPDLHPEHLEALRVLSQTVSVILEGFIARKDSIQIDQAERSLGRLSHMIGTRYAWLWPSLSAYKRLEVACPQLAELNAEFGRGLCDLDAVLSHAKEMLRGVVLNPAAFDLVECLKVCFTDLSASYHGPDRLDVVADEFHLKGALKEILANSRKALRNLTEPRIKVSLDSSEKAGSEWVRIIIQDDGPGVPLEYKECIFDDFFSYDPFGQLGTGLGLGLVSRVVRAHGGTICETGEPHRGARFEVELPRRVTLLQSLQEEARV